VACALKCFIAFPITTVIAFDDFKHRTQYHIVLDFFDIIETTQDGSMVILRKKNVDAPTEDLLSKYSIISD